MSIDPPYTAEFANAGFLAADPRRRCRPARRSSPSRARSTPPPGTTSSSSAPFWSNTQVLWYRKSFAEKAGLDMTKPVTWDQIIDAAADNGGTVGVQANKYEGYVVWINALISGAGGDDRRPTPTRASTPRSTIDSQAGDDAAQGHRGARRTPRPRRPTCRSPTRAPAGARSAVRPGAFMVNWTYICTQLRRRPQPDVAKDDSATRCTPRPSQGEASRPPYGGIGIGVSEYSEPQGRGARGRRVHHLARRTRASNAELTGNMPASAAGYDGPGAAKSSTPTDLLDAVPGEPRRGGPALGHAVLERHLRRASRARGTRRRRVNAGHPAGVARRSSRTSSTERALL